TIGFRSHDGIYTSPRFGGEFALALEAPEGTRTYGAFAGALGVIGGTGSGIIVFEQADPAANPRSYALPWTRTYEGTAPLSVAIDAAGTRLARSSETHPDAFDVYDLSGDEAVLMTSAAMT